MDYLTVGDMQYVQDQYGINHISGVLIKPCIADNGQADARKRCSQHWEEGSAQYMQLVGEKT